MPSPYKLKKDPLDENRVKKLIKNIIEGADKDRDLAKETFDYFKEKVDADTDDQSSKTQMTKCLQLMQSAGDRVTELLKMVKGVQAGKPNKDKLESVSFIGRKK